MTSLNKPFYSSGIYNKVVPLPLIYIYPILVITDIYLTYLGSPDLKSERNIIINTFNMDWLQIILGASIVVFLTIVLTVKANSVFVRKNNQNRIILNKYELFFCFVLCYFYAHLFSSFFVVISNYLTVISLYGISDFVLKVIAIKYVHFYQQNISWYFKAVISILSIIGIIVTILRLRKIRSNTKKK
jgi:hypothetical protein